MKPFALSFFAIALMAYLQTAQLSAQNLPKSLDELVQQIQSQPDDDHLNAFLVQQDLLTLAPPDASDIVTLGFEVDSTPFHVENVVAEVQHRNLFGDKTEESILVIRSESNCVLNVFFEEDGKLTKVPGTIGLNAGNDPSYFDQGFDFTFEEIAAEGEYCIVSETAWGYVRSFLKQVNIIQVRSEGMSSAYSFDSESSSYSGSLLYSYDMKQSHSFSDDRKFPRELILDKYELDEENEVMTDGGDVLKGKSTIVEGSIRVIFKVEGGTLVVADEIRDLATSTETFSYTKDGGGHDE